MTSPKKYTCATEGCTTKFVRHCNRHKYCEECQKVRKAAYFKDWYETVGREHKKKYYTEHWEEINERQKAYAKKKKGSISAEAKEKRRKYDAAILAGRRERRSREADAGGRSFQRKRARVSEKYLPEHLIWGTSQEIARRSSECSSEQDQQSHETSE